MGAEKEASEPEGGAKEDGRSNHQPCRKRKEVKEEEREESD